MAVADCSLEDEIAAFTTFLSDAVPGGRRGVATKEDLSNAVSLVGGQRLAHRIASSLGASPAGTLAAPLRIQILNIVSTRGSVQPRTRQRLLAHHTRVNRLAWWAGRSAHGKPPAFGSLKSSTVSKDTEVFRS